MSVSVRRPVLLLTATHVVLLGGAVVAAALPLAACSLREDRSRAAVTLHGEGGVVLVVTLGDAAWLALMPPLRAALARPRAGGALGSTQC